MGKSLTPTDLQWTVLPLIPVRVNLAMNSQAAATREHVKSQVDGQEVISLANVSDSKELALVISNFPPPQFVNVTLETF